MRSPRHGTVSNDWFVYINVDMYTSQRFANYSKIHHSVVGIEELYSD